MTPSDIGFSVFAALNEGFACHKFRESTAHNPWLHGADYPSHNLHATPFQSNALAFPAGK